uniref:Uncharacterized protein n=1 Tax=Myoviridae sp. ctzyI3 TaxID=2826722 RepID=A0A8S5MLL6_9CAUD|nr:MAG TPA: hypothetical protein [Myoviridae sp. ctzyI3]
MYHTDLMFHSKFGFSRPLHLFFVTNLYRRESPSKKLCNLFLQLCSLYFIVCNRYVIFFYPLEGYASLSQILNDRYGKNGT